MLAEDSAALVGLAIAAVGIGLSQHWQMPALDGAASVPISILLASVAGLRAWQSRGLLIGEGIRPQTARAIRDIALHNLGCGISTASCRCPVGLNDALVTMDLDFDGGIDAADAALALADAGRRVRDRFPMIQRLFIESDSPVPQRWTRPDAIRTLPAATAMT